MKACFLLYQCLGTFIHFSIRYSVKVEMFGVEKRDKMGSSGYVPDNKNLKKSSGTPNLFFDSRKNVFLKG